MNLKAQFFNAFASRPRPTADQIIRSGTSLYEGKHLRELLGSVTSEELTASDIRTIVEGNLSMLTPEAFRYFLPAFMGASLESDRLVSIFSSELIGALTEPSRTDVIESLDKLAQAPFDIGLPPEMIDLLTKQQLEWIDSGLPQRIFHDRVDSLTPAEGAAVLSFLEAFRAAHGEDFPFGELETAIERHWSRYRGG